MKKKLKFIHITKCAGTSIEDIGKTINQKWGKNDPNLPFWHYPLHKLSIRLQKKFDWFAVVRHPYTRLISEFYCPWGGSLDKKIETRKEFNQYLKSQLKLIYENPWFRNGHYTPQYLYFENATIQHILYFENIHEEFSLLMNKYELNCTLKKPVIEKNIRFSPLDFDYELLNLIHLVYAKDFELFKFSKKKSKN